MSEESLPHGVTTTSTYIDLGAVTKEAFAISHKSRMLARATLGNETPEDRIRQRCSIAVGDFAMAPLLRFQSDPVPALLAVLARNAPIFTDIQMVNLGIERAFMSDHLCLGLWAGDGKGAGDHADIGRVPRTERPAQRCDCCYW